MRAFTIGIHFINTIRGGRSGISEASNAILHHNGELLLQLCSNIFGLFILYTIAVTVSTTASMSFLLLLSFLCRFQQLVLLFFYHSIQSCQQWSHNSFVIFHLHFLLRYLN